MLSLPLEVQLRILKYLNFNQLFSVKQTNFCNLINKYEGELARMEFERISIDERDDDSDYAFHDSAYASHHQLFTYKSIEPQSGVFEFTLNAQLRKRWLNAITRLIPLFLKNSGNVTTTVFITVCSGGPRIILNASDLVNRDLVYRLKLPTYPKNIQEMIIARCWLERLFKCAFGCLYFFRSVFNPEMINILFDNDTTIPRQFNIKVGTLLAYNEIFEKDLNFVSNHLSISESLIFDFRGVDFTEKYTNILFNMLINEGNKIPKIKFTSYKLTRLYDLITEYIATSEDCSKIVSDILFQFDNSPPFKLSERAEKVEIKQVDDVKYTKYQISNINDPIVKFDFHNEEDSDGWTFCNKVEIMKNN
uniref:F-box domain-containing protein n=1 Tax=Meloidogyne enterolobii TaxID=390850 RepID=A0A6V7YBU5_MELEN|nr:unnamed protein product [Meloidogyne enterolobii]